MGAFVRILASVKTALEGSARPAPPDHNEAPFTPPETPPPQLAEMTSTFARELEAVGGHFAGAIAPRELAGRVIELADQTGALAIAMGEGVSFDSASLANALEQRGRDVTRCAAAGDEEARRALIERLARADLGIVEAHCAIASTGTLVIAATPTRPGALTLLPPALLAIVRADRLIPDAAAALAALGPETIAQHRVVFITGPSRTADIEKLIVIGVHGPRQVHVLLVWPRDDQER